MLRMVEVAVRGTWRSVDHPRHVATSNPVLIAELKLGYAIVSTQYNEQMAPLVRLSLHVGPTRSALFAESIGTFVPSSS